MVIGLGVDRLKILLSEDINHSGTAHAAGQLFMFLKGILHNLQATLVQPRVQIIAQVILVVVVKLTVQRTGKDAPFPLAPPLQREYALAD